MSIDTPSVRVLHLVNSLETGGAQSLIETLSRDPAPGQEIHVAVLLGRDTLSDRVERLATTVTYFDVGAGGPALVRGIRSLRRAVQNVQPDVIHSHLLQSDLVALSSFTTVPVVSTVHTSGGHERHVSSRLVTRLVRSVSGRFATLVACSSSAAEFARVVLNRVPEEIILNGVDIPRVPAAESHARFILSLARWDPMKDHRSLFTAMQSLGERAPRLVCAGAGMEIGNPHLERLLADFPELDIDLRGAVTEPERLLEEARCLVISSSHGEALPMSGIEALSLGIPVVTTDVGDCGRLAVEPWMATSPSDPVALAGAIVRVLAIDDNSLRISAREKACRDFDANVVRRKYGEIYVRVIREAAG